MLLQLYQIDGSLNIERKCAIDVFESNHFKIAGSHVKSFMNKYG